MAHILSLRSIAHIKPGDTDIMLVGVILACQPPKQFGGHDVSNIRYVLNFTLRDSLEDTINVAFWGRENNIHLVYALCQIGSAVQVCNPKLKQDSKGAMYRPRVTNCTELVVAEGGNIRKYVSPGANDPLYQKFEKFARVPPPYLTEVYCLADVSYNRASFEGQLVSLLVAVKQVKEPRNLQTQFGNKIKQDLEVFDRTGSGFIVTLWDEPLQELAASWLPYRTVLLLADVKLSFNAFEQKLVASTCSRTICIAQPDTEAGKALANYSLSAATVAHLMEEPESAAIPHSDLSTIKTIYNIRQLKEKLLAERGLPDWEQKETMIAVLYSIINTLDLDGPTLPIVTKCGNCFSSIEDRDGFGDCDKPTCADLFFEPGSSKPKVTRQFDIQVQLIDHSGMVNSRLTGKTAERVLRCKVEEYLAMDMTSKTKLKWGFLLKQFKVGVRAKPGRGNFESVYIVGIEEAHPMEIASKTQV